MNTEAKDWIVNEDAKCIKPRIANLKWLIKHSPNKEIWIFHGGTIAEYLFEEARYCFVYSQYLSTIILGFAFIEHTLGAMFFATGRDDLERENFSKILKEAQKIGWLSNEEYQNLLKAKKIRNPITHFRKPLHEDTIDFKAISKDKHQYYIIEEDAKYVLTAAFRLIDKNASQ